MKRILLCAEPVSYTHLDVYKRQELNNAKALLSALAVMRSQFRQGKLPGTRKEFESRAVLYEMVHDLQEFLRIKRRFAEEVTEGQKKLYWQEHIEKVPAEDKGPSES